jgi:hypothetical protein
MERNKILEDSTRSKFINKGKEVNFKEVTSSAGGFAFV